MEMAMEQSNPQPLDTLAELDKIDVPSTEIESDVEGEEAPIEFKENLDEKVTPEGEEVSEGEDKEDKEEKIELKDTEEDEIEFHDMPKRQEILKKYPDIFKTFPSIEKAIYREQKYAEVFPTIADAQEAVEQINNFKIVETELLDGNLSNLLMRVKESSPESFSKITGGLLQTMRVVDQNAYFDTLNYVIKSTINGAFQTAKESGDEQLQIAAQLLNKHVYGTPKLSAFAPNQPQVDKVNPREQQIAQKEQEIAGRELRGAVDDVTTRANNLIRSNINQHIDPNNKMSAYVKKNAITDAMSAVESEIKSDVRFMNTLNRLWSEASSNGLNESSRIKIRNAVIAKAKSVYPDIIRRVRNEALSGSATRGKDASESKDKSPLPAGRSAGSSSGGKKAIDFSKIPKGASTFDILNMVD